MKAIINAKIVTLNGIIWDGVVTFENGRLVDVDWANKVSIPEGAEIIDAKGLYVAPGFVDIHNHGAATGRYDQDAEGACRYHMCHGTTTVLPTISYFLTLDEMIEACKRTKAASKTGAGRMIAGMYMEGPFMNTGCSNQKYVLWTGDIVPEEYVPLVQAFKGFAKVWAIDPARPGLEPFMQYLRQEDPNAIFALGHSRATFAQCRALRKYGIRVQTHFNDSGQAKGFAQGTAGSGCDHYTLHEPDMYAELICDYTGVHVDADLIKTLIRTKGVERVCLITDHTNVVETYTNNEEDGIAWGPDLNYDYEGHLAGSKMPMNEGVRNIMKHTAYGLAHAVRMGSYNAACLLGMDDEIGSLEPGKKANILIIDDMANIKSVYFEGEHLVQDGQYIG